MAEGQRGLSSLQGESVLIVGAGREGVALANAVLVAGNVSWVRALDGSDGDNAKNWVSTFGDRIPLLIWDETEGALPAELGEASIAVMSPGIPVTGALHRSVSGLGIPVTSGTALFVADRADAMVGVTGSKGKSTTTTLIHHLMTAQGSDVALGGNMGIPVQSLDTAERYCVELSSYQCRYLEASPAVCVVTALFPEHLDWHGSLDEYYRDKLNLISYNPSVIVANGDDAILRHEVTTRFPDAVVTWVGAGEDWHLEADANGSWLVGRGSRLCHSSDIPLLGRHNHQNALLALAAASAATGLDPALLAAGFAGFEALPNRLEKISDPSGLVFVNDSLATNPQATVMALRALDTTDIALIIGGQDRGVDYQPLLDEIVSTRPRVVLGLPESGAGLLEKCARALEAAGVVDQVHLEPVASMEHAVRRARALMTPGSSVVLSPGAPSFGVYRDYQHRADDFRHWITETIEDTP